MRRIIISDTHIGSNFYKVKELTEFLTHEKYDQLILAGDIIDLVKIPTFTKQAAALIKAIDFDKEIIYIVGNHDIGFAGFIGEELFKIKFMDKYEFEEGGRKFRVQHGDQFESGQLHHGMMIKLISIFQVFLEQKFDIDLASWYTKRIEKRRKLRRVWDILSWNEDVDVVISGHVHIPEAVVWIDENNRVLTYCNSGDWVTNSTFVLVEDGIVRLRKYEGPESCGLPVEKLDRPKPE